jgi:hypothetical protein
VRVYPPEFTICYVVHGDLPLLEKVIPESLAVLCTGTSRGHDHVLVVDGASEEVAAELLGRSADWGFDEVRIRGRRRHHAGGDPSNNAHAHLMPAKGRFLISIEGDVAVFRTGPGDVLDAVARAFDAVPDMAIATRIDDHDCWQWPLREVGPAPAPGVRSVNRVASHLLVYDLPRFAVRTSAVGPPPHGTFHDDETGWFNYEDWLSATFAAPAGPGIGFLDDLPVRVYHCDRKVAPGSAYYQRDLTVRLAEFDRRRRECGAR